VRAYLCTVGGSYCLQLPAGKYFITISYYTLYIRDYRKTSHVRFMDVLTYCVHVNRYYFFDIPLKNTLNVTLQLGPSVLFRLGFELHLVLITACIQVMILMILNTTVIGAFGMYSLMRGGSLEI
jgi:hypothetical protein